MRRSVITPLLCAAFGVACIHNVDDTRGPVELSDDTTSTSAVSFAVPTEVEAARVYFNTSNDVFVSDDVPWHYGLVDLNPGARVRLDLFTVATEGNVGFKVYRVQSDGTLTLLGVVDGIDGWAAAVLRSTNGGSYVIESVGEVLPATLALFIECRNRNGDCSPSAQPGELCGTRGAKSCDGGLFCHHAEGCGRDDRGGSCEQPAQICPAVFGPQICGCDGKNYASLCEAQSVGMNADYVGSCPCDPFSFQKAGGTVDLVGEWIGKVSTDEFDISSRLAVRDDGTYTYAQTWDPVCLRVAPYCRRASLVLSHEGTYENRGSDLQLLPSDPASAPLELAQSFSVEMNCEGTVQLTTTEL